MTGQIDLSTDRAQENEELQSIVQDYRIFTLCCAIGKTPNELEDMDGLLVQKWLIFMSAQAEAENKNEIEKMKVMMGGRNFG